MKIDRKIQKNLFTKNKDKSLKLIFTKKTKKLKLISNRISIIIISLIFIIIFAFVFNKKPYIYLFNYITNKINSYKYINNITKTNNNRGFLKINTIHKSKYTTYNYQDNIIVYKDLFNNITYESITESNSIIKSNHIANDSYFELCKKKSILHNIKYKRSTKPKISVIVPFYNKDKFNIYINLRSIQNQSFKDIEIIFVDDGSSENKFYEVIEEMKNDNRIIILKHKKNKGTLMTRVDGVRYASGEYILNIDQDDLFIDNLLFENLYKKAKEINVDMIQFRSIYYKDKFNVNKAYIKIPKNIIITQPELRILFLKKIRANKLGGCTSRAIWDKFVRREVYLEAIKDLGDEYLNHRIFLYEDTIMAFELSQIAYSYYFYDIIGYRLNVYIQGKSRNSQDNSIRITAMNNLYFIKLLLYKIAPSYDRYHIFKEWGFGKCGAKVMYLDKTDIDCLKEVLEVIYELERLYKNTDKELLQCANKIKNFHGIV